MQLTMIHSARVLLSASCVAVAQITSIRDRLKTWAAEVHETALFLESSAPELIKPGTI